jgi:uncharacterized protein (TIGR02001 family)
MYASTLRAGLFTAGLALSLPGHSHAQDASPLPGTFTGNIAIVSDYIIRGASLSNQNPAIQGGFDWDSGTGIYAGMWGSSVEFGNDASVEIDFFTGYRGRIDAFIYEIGASYYWYPKTIEAGQSFWDIHVDAGYDFGAATVTLGAAYTTDDYGPLLNDQTLYYSADVAIPLAELMTVSGGAGYSTTEGRANYSDWNVGTTFAVYDWFNLDARYFDSDNEDVCGTHCDSRFVVMVSRTF